MGLMYQYRTPGEPPLFANPTPFPSAPFCYNFGCENIVENVNGQNCFKIQQVVHIDVEEHKMLHIAPSSSNV
jgi:hypothetical protein